MVGSPIVRGTIGPASSRLGKALAEGGLYLAHCALATPLWQAGCLQADLDHKSNGVSSDTLVRLASGFSRQVLRSAVWRVMFWRMHDSTFASRAHWGVAAIRQIGEKIQFCVLQVKIWGG